MDHILTPADVLAGLNDTVLAVANEYNNRLSSLPAESTTEKKALIIQREMATLYLRTILAGYGRTPNDALLAFMDKRLRQVAGTCCPALLAFYEAAAATDHAVMCPYLLGHTFQRTQFLRPWSAELAKAEASGDVAAAFELKLKRGTVAQVLAATDAWWQAQGDALPVIPKSVWKEFDHA